MRSRKTVVTWNSIWNTTSSKKKTNVQYIFSWEIVNIIFVNSTTTLIKQMIKYINWFCIQSSVHLHLCKFCWTQIHLKIGINAKANIREWYVKVHEFSQLQIITLQSTRSQSHKTLTNHLRWMVCLFCNMFKKNDWELIGIFICQNHTSYISQWCLRAPGFLGSEKLTSRRLFVPLATCSGGTIERSLPSSESFWRAVDSAITEKR